MANLAGTGYQWRKYPELCRADLIAAGELTPCCGPDGASSSAWFWLFTAAALAVAFFAPKGRRG